MTEYHDPAPVFQCACGQEHESHTPPLFVMRDDGVMIMYAPECVEAAIARQHEEA